MKIHFIGTSDGYPSTERNCSCTVVTVNGVQYVIDAGISLYTALLHNGYQPGGVGAVFITHMHGDHSSGLVEFADHKKWGSGRTELTDNIFLPTVAGKLAMEALAEAMDSGPDLNMKVYEEGLVFEDENVKVTAFRTEHGAATFGFLLEAEGKRVYFSGDMSRDIHDMPPFVYEEATDLIICESAHNCLPAIADKLNAMKTARLIINHLAPKHSFDEFDQCKPLMKKPFDMAFDGMVIEL